MRKKWRARARREEWVPEMDLWAVLSCGNRLAVGVVWGWGRQSWDQVWNFMSEPGPPRVEQAWSSRKRPVTSVHDAYFRMIFVKCYPLYFTDLLRHHWRCLRSGAVFGAVAGQSDGTLESVCYPGDLASWWGSFMLPLTICPQPSHGISTHREQLPFPRPSWPTVPLPGYSSRLPWASVCAEGLLVFHKSFESDCPRVLHLSDRNTEVLKFTCCCWNLAVTIVPRGYKSSSLRPVSSFLGNPESQMITYELLTLSDKWVTIHSSSPTHGQLAHPRVDSHEEAGSFWALEPVGMDIRKECTGEFRIWILVTPLGGFQCVFIFHCSWCLLPPWGGQGAGKMGLLHLAGWGEGGSPPLPGRWYQEISKLQPGCSYLPRSFILTRPFDWAFSSL